MLHKLQKFHIFRLECRYAFRRCTNTTSHRKVSAIEDKVYKHMRDQCHVVAGAHVVRVYELFYIRGH